MPYEWILGAMFVASFAVAPRDLLFTCRALWLILIAPTAGVALGVKRKPWDVKPRAGVVLLAGAVGWLIATIAFAIGILEPWSRDARETVYDVLFVIVPAAGAGSFLTLFLAAARPGRYRELGVFLNAALLLLFAFMFDALLTPKS